MTPEEQRVWSVIQRHRGENNAIGQKALGIASGLSERKARKIVNRLIVGYSCMIASCCNPGGYYIPETQQEINEAFERLRGHALAMLKRASVLKKIDWQQLQLELPGVLN